MPSYYTLTAGTTAQAQDVNQLVNAMNGSAGNGIPTSLTAVNDSVNFALAVKNADPTNSRALQVLRANNNVLIQADASGVIVSPDGGATTGQVVTVNSAQTFSALKTLTAGLQVTSGNVGIGGAPVTNNGLLLTGTTVVSSATVAYGLVSDATYDSGATAEADAIRSRVQTAAAAFTLASARSIHALNPIKGAGSTITSAYGLLVDAITAGGTNNYGIRVLAPSGGATDNLALFTTGGVRMTTLPGFTAGSAYLIIDASGNVRISAIGPAS